MANGPGDSPRWSDSAIMHGTATALFAPAAPGRVQTGRRRNLGTFDTKVPALAHERAVYYFKHSSIGGHHRNPLNQPAWKQVHRILYGQRPSGLALSGES
jgi:hypothetical protein